MPLRTTDGAARWIRRARHGSKLLANGLAAVMVGYLLGTLIAPILGDGSTKPPADAHCPRTIALISGANSSALAAGRPVPVPEAVVQRLAPECGAVDVPGREELAASPSGIPIEPDHGHIRHRRS